MFRTDLALDSTYFDVELQVLIHGINVVEDVLHNSGDDSHHVLVVEFPLRRTIKMKIVNVSVCEECCRRHYISW